MNKNLLLIVTTFLALTGSAFGVYQKSKTTEALAVCETQKAELTKFAEQQQQEAKVFREMAEQARLDAEVQRTICEEQLKSLKK